MEILKRRRNLAAACGLLLLAAGLGCAFLPGGDGSDGALVFSHALHVGELELECINCHEDGEAADDPGMPALSTCSLCHDELDTEKSEDRRIVSLFDEDAFRAVYASKLADELRFSHLTHVRQGLECAACHVGIDESTRLRPAMNVPMGRCTECHEERQVANECSTCHTTVDTGWAPANHAHDWMRAHGACARAKNGRADQSCALCHSSSTCTSCHLAQAPDDHEAFFRRRGHGILASMDRARCSACHEPDSCSRCHAETRPLSHSGTWGAPRDVHCLGCHEPVRLESCALCHAGTPSHALATPKPADHHPAMNCRQCHGLSAPLPHVENGSDCNACHP